MEQLRLVFQSLPARGSHGSRDAIPHIGYPAKSAILNAKSATKRRNQMDFR